MTSDTFRILNTYFYKLFFFISDINAKISTPLQIGEREREHCRRSSGHALLPFPWMNTLGGNARIRLKRRLLGGLVLLGLNLLGLGLLAGNALLSASSGLLVLVSPGFGLIGQLLGAESLRLLLVDELHQNALVLEHVTLALDVELVVQMAIDFLVLSVLLQEATEDAHPPHPQLLDGHAGVGGTLALTGAGVTALATRES